MRPFSPLLGGFFIGAQPHLFYFMAVVFSMDFLNLTFVYTLALLGVFILTGVFAGVEKALWETTGYTYAALVAELRLQAQNAGVKAGVAFEGLLAPKKGGSTSYFRF